MHRLRTDRQAALPLIEAMEHHLSVHAVVRGTMPGWMYVDDPLEPRTAFAFNNEGWYLIGEPDNPPFVEWLVPFIRDEVIPGARAHGDDEIPLHYDPAGWQALGDWLLPGQTFRVDHQHYFRCEQVAAHRPPTLEGYVLRAVDADVLEREGDPVVPRMRRWAAGAFGSIDAYLVEAIGRCIEHDGRLVSWCMPDCATRGHCEVGIHTLPEHRRRGLAACVVAATVGDCFARGYEWVGWHCWSANQASANLARKVGFRHVCDHGALVVTV